MSMKFDAELDGAADDPPGLVAVLRLAPDAGPGDPHGAEAEPVHRPQVDDLERSAVSGNCHGGDNCAAAQRLFRPAAGLGQEPLGLGPNLGVAGRSSPAASNRGSRSRSIICARKNRLMVTSWSGRCTTSIGSPAWIVAGADHPQVGPRPGVGGEQLQPALLPDPAAEGRARDTRRRSPPARRPRPTRQRSPTRASFTSMPDVVRFSPKNPVGQLPTQPLRPAV